MFGGKSFKPQDIPNLTGKVAIVTGSTAGIGKEVALQLAKNGCCVIISGRTVERCEIAAKEISEQSLNNNIKFITVDLASFSSIVRFVREFKSLGLPLHILINNAGCIAEKFEKTEDGFEKQFQANYLGHYLLTMELLPILQQSTPSRIINLSSQLHCYVNPKGFDFEEMMNKSQNYQPTRAYSMSKLAIVMATKSLSKRLEGKGVSVNAVHPGFVATELAGDFEKTFGFMVRLVYKVIALSAIKPSDGALSTLYAATSPDIDKNMWSGEYIVPYGKIGKPSKWADNALLQEKLWMFSEKATRSFLSSPIEDS